MPRLLKFVEEVVEELASVVRRHPQLGEFGFWADRFRQLAGAQAVRESEAREEGPPMKSQSRVERFSQLGETEPMLLVEDAAVPLVPM